MKSNLGTTDRIVRVLIFLGAMVLYFMKVTSGFLGITFMVIAVVLLLTSLLNFCPVYAVLGITTKTKK